MNLPDTPSDSLPRRGYETRDVTLSAILWLALGIMLLAIFAIAGLFYLLRVYHFRAARNDPQLSPLVNPDQTPPLPRLQSAPMADYADFVTQQEKQLHSYGWIDREKGIVHVPLSRAVELALERGLPKPAVTKKEDAREVNKEDIKEDAADSKPANKVP